MINLNKLALIVVPTTFGLRDVTIKGGKKCRGQDARSRKPEMVGTTVKANKLLLILLLFFTQLYAGEHHCAPVLWPHYPFTENQLMTNNHPLMLRLIKEANKSVKLPPNPISQLSTAGITNSKDATLLSSRESLQDADRAAVLSLAYQLTHNEIYFNKARDILLSWSAVNQPTGNPIDENRLAGMIWAYDLISCFLSQPDKTQILAWFTQIRNKKLAWKFGPLTTFNNHRIHQLKMLLLLNKVLGDTPNWQDTVNNAIKYSSININPETGESIDYRERSALYYHNYALQSWIEISILSRCCQKSTTRAMDFLVDHIRSNNITGEFSASQAKIDKLREQGDFDYAKKNGTFQITKAAPTIAAYYTLMPNSTADDLWNIVNNAKPSPWLTFLMARGIIWN